MNCRQSSNLQLSKSRSVLIFVIGVVECMLFAGTVFGWPQLVHVLKVEGLYADLCDGTSFLSESVLPSSSPTSGSSLLPFASSSPAVNITVLSIDVPPLAFNSNRCHGFNSTNDVSSNLNPGVQQCEPQDEMFALIFTITVSFYSLSGILIGYLLHHVGLRVTRISTGIMLTISFIFLGLATKETPNYLFPAMVLLALAGNQLRMSVVQFGDLFPRHRSTTITLLSGMYAASAALFLLFQYAADVGIERQVVCWGLAGLSILTILMSFIMPIHHIPVPASYIERTNQGSKDPPPLSQSLWSLSSFLHQVWYFLGLLVMNNYQQNYNVWVNMSTCSVEEAGKLSAIYSYSNLVTVFFGPMGGAFTDYMVRRAGKTTNELRRRVKEIQASFWPLLVANITTTVMYGCMLFLTPTAVYISLLCMVVCRPCNIAVSTAYLRIRFPADHFNRLLGIYGTITSLLMFIQYPHFIWAQHFYYTAHGLVLVLSLLSAINPLHLLVTPYMRKVVITRDQLTQDTLEPATSPQDYQELATSPQVSTLGEQMAIDIKSGH